MLIPVTTPWRVIGTRIKEATSGCGEELQIYRISSRGQPIRCDPSAWGLGEGLQTPYCKQKLVTKCYIGPWTLTDSLERLACLVRKCTYRVVFIYWLSVRMSICFSVILIFIKPSLEIFIIFGTHRLISLAMYEGRLQGSWTGGSALLLCRGMR
jgi:hypothetical protein